MKPLCRYIATVFAACLFLLVPAVGSTRSTELVAGAPPVDQPLVSEGDFAISLGTALAVTTTGDQIVAETILGDLEIAPRNGWISDYPVTPDIIVELRVAVANAADDGLLRLSRSEALKRMDDVAANYGLGIRTRSEIVVYDPSAESCATYPNPADIRNSYTEEGTPVVTYYCPPPDYYGMYAWIPCPFWWNDLWFPGYFILNDFHRIINIHNRTVVIRNHFNDLQQKRAFRIDPTDRFRGKTYGGIGIPRNREVLSTGVPRSDNVIFNRPQSGRMDSTGTNFSPSRNPDRAAPNSRHEERPVPAMRQEQQSAPVIHHEERTAPTIHQEHRPAPVMHYEDQAPLSPHHEQRTAPISGGERLSSHSGSANFRK